uniref:Uncharacterized protein n=1 Tax=Oryza rufipogon TaxID=4529 RepID=A0A0E0MXP8_ORYRU
MGKKRGGHGHAPAAPLRAVSLREESSGKTRADAASLLRVQHLQRLAAWAGPPSAPCWGHASPPTPRRPGYLWPPPPSYARVLQPGFNCTIRIKNNKRKAKRRKKLNTCQNSISYLCHFCGDQIPVPFLWETKT